MKIDDVRQITAADLRVIVLALKMEEFNIDHERARNDIYERVKGLPSAENINVLASNGKAIKGLQNEIGYILEMVDKYDARDADYKFRYRARTGLDPRHKILEYKRITAQKEIKMRKEATNLVKELERVSSVADVKGLGIISGELVRCAKNIKDENYGQVSQLDLQKIATSLRDAGLTEDADRLEKEAGFWDSVSSGWGGVKNLGKEVGKGVADIATDQYQKARGAVQIGKLKTTFERINKDIAEAVAYANTAAQQAVNPQKAEQIANMVAQLGNMQMMGQEVYKIIQGDAATEQTEQTEQVVDLNQTEQFTQNQDVNTQNQDLSGAVEEVAQEQAIAPETSSFSQGQNVTWESGGNLQSGTVISEDPANPSKTVVQIGNYPPQSLDTQALKVACETYRLKRQG